MYTVLIQYTLAARIESKATYSIKPKQKVLQYTKDKTRLQFIIIKKYTFYWQCDIDRSFAIQDIHEDKDIGATYFIFLLKIYIQKNFNCLN